MIPFDLKFVFQHADIAAAPLAITGERDTAVDFTIPFRKAELGVLIMHPNWVREHVFAVMFPYSATVWVFFVLAILFVGALLWLMSYFNPYEWRSLAQRGEATEEQGNYLNMWNAPWFQVRHLYEVSFHPQNLPSKKKENKMRSMIWLLSRQLVFRCTFCRCTF